MSVSFHTRLASLSLVQIYQNLPEASGPTTNRRPGLLIQKNSPIDTVYGHIMLKTPVHTLKEMIHYSVSLTAYTDS